MKRTRIGALAWAAALSLSLAPFLTKGLWADGVIDEPAEMDDSAAKAQPSDEATQMGQADTTEQEAEPTPAPTPKPAAGKRIPHADAFIAGPDWEFDGFVAGGQDMNVRAMFYLNDLVYLNVGSQQGLSSGDTLYIYKRGERIRDPQSGRFLGYEVRRAGICRVSDKVDNETASARVTMNSEPIEVGDLVRKAD